MTRVRQRSKATRLIVSLLLLVCLVVPLSAKRISSQLTLATREIPEDQLLDISIKIFRAMDARSQQRLTKDKKIKRVYPDIRRSEARYLPVRLKTTLERSGHWGAVRVVPELSPGTMLSVTASIAESYGGELALKVRVSDSRGYVWVQEEFQEFVDDLPSLTEKEGLDWVDDPFQKLYNRIANRILEARRKLTAADIKEVQQVAQLRFAANLAPDSFGENLQKDRKGRWVVRRLPAEEDPMMERVTQIQQREYMLIDTLNDHYSQFHDEMNPSYDEWRHQTDEEFKAFRKMRSSARKRKTLGILAILAAIALENEGVVGDGAAVGGVLAGMQVFQSGLERSKESKIHLEALEELTNSFEGEIEPMVVEVEGEVVRLQGSAEEQYSTWQQLMGRLFEQETGFDSTVTSDDPVPDGETVPSVSNPTH